MPSPTPWGQFQTIFSIVATVITTTAETAIATVGNINSRAPGAAININGVALVTLGTGVTACVMRIRADSLTGAIVNQAETENVTASLAVLLEIQAQDSTAVEYAGKNYVFTVTCTGATGNSTAQFATLTANY